MGGRYCVRVYPNGEAKHTVRDDEGMAHWLEYNRSARPGNALFVDGELACPTDDGGLTGAQVEHVSGILRREVAQGLHAGTKPDRIGPQVEFIAGQPERYNGYRGEDSRRPFRLPEREPAPRR